MKFAGNNSRKRSGGDRGGSDSYMLDPLLVPRLKHFSYNNSIADVDVCVEYLRRNYKEYSRKQQGPFRKLVLKAIHILNQKRQKSRSLRETKLQCREKVHARRLRRQSASDCPSDSSSDEAREESFVSGVRDLAEASGDDGQSRAETSFRKKRKRKLSRDKVGSGGDSTDDDNEVLGLSPAFNMLNSSLRTAYHGRSVVGKTDMDGSSKVLAEKVSEISKQAVEDREPTIVQAFAPSDVIAAAARAAAANISKKHVEQMEGSISSTDVASDSNKKTESTELPVKPDPSSGIANAPENHQMGKIPEKGNEKVVEKAVTRNGKPEKVLSKKKAGVSERKEKEIASNTTAEAVRFSDLGGIDYALDSIREIMFPLYNPDVYSWLGLQPIRGVLLHGPPGCGKTKLANAIAHEAGLPFLKISGPEVVSGMSGESEAKVRSLFAEAARLAPCIVFIDEIDSITSKRENAQREMERRIVTQLMTCMDELSEKPSDEMHESAFISKRKGHILVIGATNRPEGLDPALRRPGRFDREILLGIPDENGRVQILSVLAKNLRLEGSFDLKRIARCTPGFVGADLAALTREAGSVAIKRIMACKNSQWLLNTSVKGAGEGLQFNTSQKNNNFQKLGEYASLQSDNSWWKEQWTPEDLHALSITMQDFEEAVALVQPSTKREGFSAIPNVKWDDVGALGSVQKSLQFFISRRIKHPEEYEMLGLDMDTGFLLYGPPGCGKTLVAKAVANDAQANFIYVKGPELLNKYVGESEHAVRALFARARSCAPCIIFFDEMDALAPRRGTDGNAVAERVLNQLLSEMDGADKRKGLFLIGATNRPDMIDPAVLRPGRLGKLLYIPLPDSEGRLSILKTLTIQKPISSDVDLSSIAVSKLCEGLSGADLAALVNEASVAALQEKCATSDLNMGVENLEPLLIRKHHFDMALSQISPSVSKQDMLYYDGLPKKFNRTKGIKGIAAEAFT